MTALFRYLGSERHSVTGERLYGSRVRITLARGYGLRRGDMEVEFIDDQPSNGQYRHIVRKEDVR